MTVGPEDVSESDSFRDRASDVLLTGFAVIVPLVVTVYVLDAAFDIIVGALGPLVRLLAWAGLVDAIENSEIPGLLIELGVYSDVYAFLTELVALIALVAAIVVVGVVARMRYGEHVIDLFDYLIESVPGIGAIYKSFRRMGDVVVESDVSNFQEVKLVEFPRDGTYVIGFVTNTSPQTVLDAADEEEMTTLFLPLAPNPVMGGFLTHVPPEQVMDVDMTVEEGIRSIITSGIAAGSEGGRRGDSETPIQTLRNADYLEGFIEQRGASDGDDTEAGKQ